MRFQARGFIVSFHNELEETIYAVVSTSTPWTAPFSRGSVAGINALFANFCQTCPDHCEDATVNQTDEDSS